MKFKTLGSIVIAACSWVVMAAEAEKGLILHLPLNEGQGVVVKDIGPRKLTGKIVSPADSKWVEGRDGGKALEFHGTNGKAPFVFVSGFAADEFSKGLTVMFYFKPDTAKYIRSSVWHLVASNRSAKGFLVAIHYQRLLIGGNGNKLAYGAASNNSKTPIRGGEWIHFAATHDGNKTFKVYIDGELAGVTNDKTGGVVTPSNGSIAIGSLYGYSPAQGVFSDVKIYNKALTDAEVMNAATGE